MRYCYWNTLVQDSSQMPYHVFIHTLIHSLLHHEVATCQTENESVIICLRCQHGRDKTVKSCFVRVSSVNTIGDKTRQFCLVSTQFPICNCLVSNISRIMKTWKLETGVETRQKSLKLGPDKRKLSYLVCNCVHTTNVDKTRQFCPVPVGGVNKLEKETRKRLNLDWLSWETLWINSIRCGKVQQCSKPGLYIPNIPDVTYAMILEQKVKGKHWGTCIVWWIVFLHVLTLSVLSDVCIRQCTIWADVHIRPGTAGSSEIIIQGRTVIAAENNKNW